MNGCQLKTDMKKRKGKKNLKLSPPRNNEKKNKWNFRDPLKSGKSQLKDLFARRPALANEGGDWRCRLLTQTFGKGV